MSALSGLATAFVITVSVSASSGGEGVSVTSRVHEFSSEHVVTLQTADCEQNGSRAPAAIIIPHIEFYLKPVEKTPAPDADAPSGFCAGVSGPVDDETVCQFRLLA